MKTCGGCEFFVKETCNGEPPKLFMVPVQSLKGVEMGVQGFRPRVQAADTACRFYVPQLRT